MADGIERNASFADPRQPSTGSCGDDQEGAIACLGQYFTKAVLAHRICTNPSVDLLRPVELLVLVVVFVHNAGRVDRQSRNPRVVQCFGKVRRHGEHHLGWTTLCSRCDTSNSIDERIGLDRWANEDNRST